MKRYFLMCERNRRNVYRSRSEEKLYKTIGSVKGALKLKLPYGEAYQVHIYELDFDTMTIKEVLDYE